MDATWDKALVQALKYRTDRSIQQQKARDPWHRALLSCTTAQRIRIKRTSRTRQEGSRSGKPEPDWETALRTALANLKATAKSRRAESEWTRALNIKVTAWNMKSTEC